MSGVRQTRHSGAPAKSSGTVRPGSSDLGRSSMDRTSAEWLDEAPGIFFKGRMWTKESPEELGQRMANVPSVSKNIVPTSSQSVELLWVEDPHEDIHAAVAKRNIGQSQETHLLSITPQLAKIREKRELGRLRSFTLDRKLPDAVKERRLRCEQRRRKTTEAMERLLERSRGVKERRAANMLSSGEDEEFLDEVFSNPLHEKTLQRARSFGGSSVALGMLDIAAPANPPPSDTPPASPRPPAPMLSRGASSRLTISPQKPPARRPSMLRMGSNLSLMSTPGSAGGHQRSASSFQAVDMDMPTTPMPSAPPKQPPQQVVVVNPHELWTSRLSSSEISVLSTTIWQSLRSLEKIDETSYPAVYLEYVALVAVLGSLVGVLYETGLFELESVQSKARDAVVTMASAQKTLIQVANTTAYTRTHHQKLEDVPASLKQLAATTRRTQEALALVVREPAAATA